jgi:hypothetical protein
MTLVMTPQPVPCRNCGYMLMASYEAQNQGLCPGCREQACYTCGCTDERACVKESRSLDETRVTELVCDWTREGPCSFCVWEAAYVLYMEATDRVPDDPFYLRTYVPGRTHRVSPLILG